MSLAPTFGHFMENDSKPRGILRANIRVPIVDLNGHDTTRRVSLGVDYQTTMEEAREKVAAAREANREMGMRIDARFTIDL